MPKHMLERQGAISSGGDVHTETIKKPSGKQVKIVSITYHSNTSGVSQKQVAYLQKGDETNYQLSIFKETVTNMGDPFTWREPQGQFWPEGYDLILKPTGIADSSIIFMVVEYETPITDGRKPRRWW